MEAPRIAALARSLTSVPSRRDLLPELAGVGIWLGTARLPLRGWARAQQRATTQEMKGGSARNHPTMR
jgi:hypothetical protein